MYSFHRLNVAYNNILRRLLRRPRFCSASGLFVECRIPNCKAVIRNLIFRFMTRLDLSKNSIIFTILGSDIRWTSRIRRHWVKSLYVHHNLVWLLLSYMCYYHFYVLHDKIDCLVLTVCISMCMDRHMYAVLILCVWNKHLSIYLSILASYGGIFLYKVCINWMSLKIMHLDSCTTCLHTAVQVWCLL